MPVRPRFDPAVRNAVLSGAVPQSGGSLPALGVGLLYNGALPEFVRANINAFDYMAITPDLFWLDRGPGQPERYEELESWVETLDWVAERRPIVSHNVGLSIGSARSLDAAYLEQIARFQSRYHFPWHSDHLSFAQLTGTNGDDYNAGLALPVLYDQDVLELLCDRIAFVNERIPIPFLLENNVHFVDVPEQDMTEVQFLNCLTQRSGCGLLLDLHNLYTNARNHGFDAFGFLDELALAPVMEIHIAGGDEFAGMYTDSHAGPVPEPVWELLDYAIARTPNLRGVTFEFHFSYYPLMGEAGVVAQLTRARVAWARRPACGN
jgi:uncharacterized protein (UPF0276 family)